LQESAHSGIEYPSPGAAYRALRANPAVNFRTQDGWVIANDQSHHVTWTFSPQGDPAFPSVVKRRLVDKDGQLSLDTSVLCGAGKETCDDFVRRFQGLDDEMVRAVSKLRAANGAASASVK
jgi:hypothetical protein